MAQHHTQQNRNTGAGFHRQRGKRGGAQYVTERHVIALDGCWCGEPLGHDWPGKDKGEPHPREEQHMVSAEWTEIARSDIKRFDAATQRLLMDCINNNKIRYRIIDGSHLLMYPPDGTSRPFKVSAARTPQTNRQIIEVQFMQEYGLMPTATKAPVKKAAAKKAATPDEVPDTTQHYSSEELLGAMREAVDLLNAALLDDSPDVAALRQDNELLRSQLDAERREVARLKQERVREAGLCDEHRLRADRAEAKLKAFRDALAD